MRSGSIPRWATDRPASSRSSFWLAFCTFSVSAHGCTPQLAAVDLRGADLRQADLAGTVVDERTQLDPEWRLVQRILIAEGQQRDLRGARMVEANLEGADLNGADLAGAALWRTDLKFADLRRADLNL